MWALPCDVYDLEPGSCYENEEPVLACRETVSRGGNCRSLLTRDSDTPLGWAAKLFKGLPELQWMSNRQYSSLTKS